ncbi:DUF2336 domain-containing protein [Mesorhizobium xinjiangense]|uniref:DUF2336 domain-containing protein n=1 Tax=Mesorhizobium xinjiangense TaxID=2678685 RepID=UPI0018DBD59D|nr:DUF2336 domain-containing protein [Mesorhizobium xinjiangense]
MFSEDFRHIARRGEQGRSDRLLRAATTAFCSLTRPTKRDARQLSQLVLPLFDRASPDARRYVAAALSGLADAPSDLVVKLANDRLDVAAPLLKCSPLLGDLDLLAVIARHGLGHARAIARRDRLNPTIASLVRALEASEPVAGTGVAVESDTTPAQSAAEKASAAKPSRADAIRDQLRSMMQASDNVAGSDPTAYLALGDPQDELDRISRVMASRLGPAGQAASGAHSPGRLFGSATIDDVIAAMKSLTISEDKALLIACSAFPEHFSDVRTVPDFVHRYRNAEPAPMSPRHRGGSKVVTLRRQA